MSGLDRPICDHIKQALHILSHALNFIVPILAFVAAILHAVGERNVWPAGIFSLVDTIIISTFLIIIEAYVIFSESHQYPAFVHQTLGFLTTLLGRGIFYQFFGGIYIISYSSWHGWSWERHGQVAKAARILGWIIWGIGVGITVVDILARAFHFTSWIWDQRKEKEGQLRLDSDDEEEPAVLVSDPATLEPERLIKN